MNLALNHGDRNSHQVDFTFEREFDKSNILSLLMPFVDDPISTRKGAFGHVKELDVRKLATSDFDLTPGKAMSKFNTEEESKDYSFFIDGESFIPERVEIFDSSKYCVGCFRNSDFRDKNSLEHVFSCFQKSLFRQLHSSRRGERSFFKKSCFEVIFFRVIFDPFSQSKIKGRLLLDHMSIFSAAQS